MKCSFEDILKGIKDFAPLAISASVGSGVVSWLGRSITHAGFLQGCGFGAIMCITTIVGTALLDKTIKNDNLRIGVSLLAGAVIAYGASAAAAAAGIVAAPITLPGALILTVSTVVFAMIGVGIEASAKNAYKNCTN